MTLFILDSLSSEAICQSGPEPEVVSPKARRQNDAEPRQQLKPLRQRRLKKQMDKLTRQKEGLESKLAKSPVHEDSGKEELSVLLHDQAVVAKELGEMEEGWLLVSDELQKAQC